MILKNSLSAQGIRLGMAPHLRQGYESQQSCISKCSYCRVHGKCSPQIKGHITLLRPPPPLCPNQRPLNSKADFQLQQACGIAGRSHFSGARANPCCSHLCRRSHHMHSPTALFSAVNHFSSVRHGAVRTRAPRSMHWKQGTPAYIQALEAGQPIPGIICL